MVLTGNGHTYQLDGQPVPGVTTVLDRGIPKGALVGWAANMVAEYVVNRLNVARNAEGKERIVADELVADLLAMNAQAKKPERVTAGERLPRLALSKILAGVRYADKDAAANRGTEVHRLAEQLAHGLEVEYDETIAGHVRAYVNFLDTWQPSAALLERVVVNRRWRYMGKLDMIADFPGTWPPGSKWHGQPVGRGLVDIKTSRSGVYAETALQLEGYRNAETMLEPDGTEVPMPAVDWVGVVWVRADGFDVYRFDTGPDTFRTFLYAKQVGDWLDWKNGPAATIRSGALRPPVVAP